MKRILLPLMLLMCSSGCLKKDTDAATAITVIVDTTDPHLLRPEANPILSLYELDRDMNQAAGFRLTGISDKLLNPVVVYQLASGAVTAQENTDEDVQHREKLVLAFYQNVRKAIADCNVRSAGAIPGGYSQCFRVIAGELGLLAQSQATERILIVFSDLQEKSDVFDCYSSENQLLLQTDPQKVAQLFIKHCPLPKDLRRVRVYLLYKPADRVTDQRYMAMASIYRYVLEQRGATVFIQANNTAYHES